MNMCGKCNGENVSMQVVNEQELKRKRRGIISWILVWWWLEIVLWVCFFVPRFFAMLFKGKKYKVKNKTVTKAVCQSCGYSWNVA